MRRYFVITVLLLASLAFAQSHRYAEGEVIVEITDNGFGDPKITMNGAIETGWGALDSYLAEIGATECRRLIPIATNPEYSERWSFTRRWFKIAFDPTFDASAIVDDLLQFEGIERAEPNWIFEAEIEPNDPYYEYQWHHPTIRSNMVWDYTPGDTAIVMSGIDSGVDYLHDDLTNMIWQNLGEDTDGDGMVLVPGEGFDPDDINDIDDDGNGYVDDFIGWDWVDGEWASCYRHPTDPDIMDDCYMPDNDPMDFFYNGHGTHVNGIMLTESNNGQGIAGVNWEGRIMCLRAGYWDRYWDGYIRNEAVIQAISYGVNMGSKIFNLSYGGYSKRYLDFDTTATRYFLGEVIDSAVNIYGCIITTSAGNDGTDTTYVDPSDPADTARYHYPSTFPQTISVANTNIEDCKSWSSNYDSTVDISAPGSDIASTVPRDYAAAPGDPSPSDPAFAEWYGTKGGTSMSAPMVAGAAALLWSFYPDSSNDWIRSRLEIYAEDIYGKACNILYSLNNGLGSGRLDVYRALGAGLFPQVELDTFVYNDTDADGRPEPDEDVSMIFTYSNTDDTIWANCNGAEVVLSSDDSLVIISDSIGFIGDIAHGVSADNSSDPVVFRMDPAYRYGRPVQFIATLRDDSGYMHATSFEILVGYPEVLVATQDTIVSNLGKVTQSLIFGGIPYDSLIIPFDSFDFERLEKHRVLIYLTGSAKGTHVMTTSIEDAIEFWLNASSADDKLCILSGQDLPENCDPTWLSDNFGASHNVDSLSISYALNVSGVPGDTIGYGIENVNIAFGSGSAGNQRSMGACSAVGDGIPFLYYDYGDLSDSTCAVRREDISGHKTVLMEFGIEGFGDSLRATFIQRLLEWGGMQYMWDVPEENLSKPTAFELLPAFPNPFNSTVNIGFVLPEASELSISIYDMSGRLVRRFPSRYAQPGPHFLRWDGRTESGEILPTGVYLYRISSSRSELTGKIIFAK